MKFCGIDLHSNNSVLVVTDEMDKRLVRRRCRNDLNTILTVLAPHKPDMAAVVVESTYNWYWLVDGLMRADFEVKLANTVAMKRYDGLKHSGDEDDAAHLAHLLRLGILPTGYIHPPAHRALRDLAGYLETSLLFAFRRVAFVRLREAPAGLLFFGDAESA